VGELVYTAFSGSHQDAINKGLAYQRAKSEPFWEVPYLPIDPADVGRTYESIIRINSQSGKGGVAYILEDKFGYQLPKKMHPEIGRIVQGVTDVEGRELTAEEILGIFEKTYFEVPQYVEFVDMAVNSETSKSGIVTVKLTYRYEGEEITSTGQGNGPIDACRKALAEKFPHAFVLRSYAEHSCGEQSSAKAVAYIEIETEDFGSFFGVGRDNDITIAGVMAMFSALNRAYHS
jgi:2-isopropylmalate synthase